MLARSRFSTLLSARRFVASRNASSLVIAEHADGALHANTLSTVTAAAKLGGDITVLVLGHNVAGVATSAAAVSGVKKVLVADHESLAHPVAENLASVAADVIRGNTFTHVLSPSSNLAKNFVPRLAGLLDTALVTDIISVESEDTVKRPLYAGNAIATVKLSDPVKLLLVRTTAFDKASPTGSSAAVESVAVTAPATLSSFVSANVTKSERPDLGAARVVVSGGRGMKSGDNFAMLATLADKLGGAVGASRAAVDAGMVPNDYQIGQTGRIVAPDLYIAVGISGAIQHLSGMKDSKTIVAINKDKEAPIFSVADLGLVDDLFKAVPEINSKI